jgi:predicted transcriptional regulator
MIRESFRNSGKYTVAECLCMSKMRSSDYLRTYLASAEGAEPKAIRPPLMQYDSQGSQMPSSRASSSSSPPSSTGEGVPSGERPRSALKIRLEILETVRDEGPSKPTKIMLMVNLSHERFVRYLQELVSRGLLKENKDSVAKSYTLTEKGLDFVNQLKEAESFVATFGLTI